MFATLVILLPSEHTGGASAVQLDTRSQGQISFPASQARLGFESSYMAWYRDVGYSMQPVTEGYQFVLTYDLIHSNEKLEEIRPASVLTDHIAIIDGAFKALEERCSQYEEVPEQLVYVLDSEDSEAVSELKTLESVDQVRSVKLSEACREHG